jgi:hypothetical protein
VESRQLTLLTEPGLDPHVRKVSAIADTNRQQFVWGVVEIQRPKEVLDPG